jgi:predicted metal-dependent RNase
MNHKPVQDVFNTLVAVVTELLVNEQPSVELVGTQARERRGLLTATPEVFQEVCQILAQAGFIPGQESGLGMDPAEPVRILHPEEQPVPENLRIRLQDSLPVSAVLKVFSLLRSRYETLGTSKPPKVVVIARADQEEELDTLYLLGDAFTERYPVAARIERKEGSLLLILEGEERQVGEGFSWDRARYIRGRDASLLIRPLRDALFGPERPLVVPRWTDSDDAVIRARLPARVRGQIPSLAWLVSLQALKERTLPLEPIKPPGEFGEHWELRSGRNGYVFWESPLQDVLPVRRRWRQLGDPVVLEDDTDGQLAVTFQGLGGVREIGANAYYYRFGRRGLLIDAGFDANLDGWLALPDLEQIERLDAIVITHAHLDHMGSLAVVAEMFPGVPIYMTLATRDILEVTLNDSVKIGKFRFDEKGEAPAITGGLVNRLDRKRFQTLDYGKSQEIPTIPGLTMTFHDAGHVIGSTGVELRFGAAKIFHTGDLSVEDQHLLKGMRLEPLEGHVVMEATYGYKEGSTGAQRQEAVQTFLRCLGERLEAGGTVLIPSFSLGRAQEVLALIADWDTGKKPSTPFTLYAVGGQTIAINEVSKQRKQFLPKLKGDPFKWETLNLLSYGTPEQRAKKAEEELRKVAARGPAVLIATHGMLMEDTGSYFLARAILTSEDPRHAIFLSGYMDPRTPGFRLLHQRGQEQIRLGTDDVVLVKRPKAEGRIQHHNLSAHGSHAELVQVARRATHSLTLVHGDEDSLDKLRAYLTRELPPRNPPLPIRAPGRGERILLERVPPPPSWEFEPMRPARAPRWNESTMRGKALSIGGLVQDPLDPNREWALLPVGETEVSLRVERNKVEEHRIEEVVVTASKEPSKRSVLYHRVTRKGRLVDLRWSTPGSYLWTVKVRSSRNKQLVEDSTFSIDCGVELQPVSLSLDALAPVLELRLGGSGKPDDVKLSPGAPATLRHWEWEESTRILRLELEPHDVGQIEPLPVSIRWGGFEQLGPAIQGVTFAPRLQPFSVDASVGESVVLTVQSSPKPRVARFERRLLTLTDGQLEVVPSKPGHSTLSLGYGLPSDPVWWEAGTLTVTDGAEVEHPEVSEIGEPLTVRIRVLPEMLRGQTAVLEAEGEELDRWSIDAGLHTWSGTLPLTGDVSLRIRVPSRGLQLWKGALELVSGVRLRTRSTPVTTADGKVEAELEWFLPKGADKTTLEHAFQQAGFEPLGWKGATLRFRGTARTLGLQEVTLGQGSEEFSVPVLTLPDNQLQLRTDDTPVAGEWLTAGLSGGELDAALPGLELTLTRVSPLIDTLSAKIEGMRVRPLHPGTYVLTLLSQGRSIAEHRFEVRWPTLPTLPQGTRSERHELTRLADASMRCAALDLGTPIAVLFADKTYTVLQGSPKSLEEEAWSFLNTGKHEHTLVLSPGLALHPISGQLLKRFWAEQKERQVARLSYPAPRGEVWRRNDSLPSLRDRVRCYLPENHSRIDLGDAYACPRCAGRPMLSTSGKPVHLSCPGCDWEDAKTIVTLDRMRQEDTQVLFTEYRMARYLMKGLGASYAGAFGRGVRCQRCHSPQPAFPEPYAWDVAELQKLVGAAADAWKRNPDTSRLARRAARRAARATRGAQGYEERRYEDLLQRLMDAGLLVEGQATTHLSRLEAGRSVCCDAQLEWTPRQLRWVFLGIEDLRKGPSSIHPGLPPDATGISRLLSLLAP